MYNPPVRKFFIIVVISLGIALILVSFTELESIVATFKKGNHWFLGLALILECLWLGVVGLTFQSIYELLGLKESAARLTLASAAALFINAVTPSAGMGGITVFLTDARGRGHSRAKVTVAGALFLLVDEAAFLCVLALGLAVLFRRDNLHGTEILASLLLVAAFATLSVLLYLGSHSAARLEKMLAGMARAINLIVRPFLRREYLSVARAHSFATEIAEGLASTQGRPAKIARPILLALLNKGLLMGVLFSAFLAFDVPFSAGTIIGGFSIAYLFLIVSPTPSGAGVVEGVLPIALGSLRVMWSQAVIVTLAYRAITFWLPLAVGAWALRFLHISSEQNNTNMEKSGGE